jgi:hypothetical protein
VQLHDVLAHGVTNPSTHLIGYGSGFQVPGSKIGVTRADAGSRLEVVPTKYETLGKALGRSEDRTKDIHDRVEAVRKVSKDLFKEWDRELGRYTDRRLRDASERELKETRRRVKGVIAAMERAEKRINPVLQPLRDRVLFLKHNLNAEALGALGKELTSVQANVDVLVSDMQQSVAEADAFIAAMQNDAKGT